MLRAFTQGEPPLGVVEILERLRETARRTHIRCPSCGWRPVPSSRWMCVDTQAPEHFAPGCGTSWNTFDTRGCCPGCIHQWQWTACLACHGWSRHDDWYAADDGDESGGGAL
jgi:hypothetical protein